jgi:hypothetical protein
VSHFSIWNSHRAPRRAAGCAHVVADGVKLVRPVDKIKYHPGSTELNDEVVNPVLREIWAGRAPVAAAFKTLQPQIQAILDRYP